MEKKVYNITSESDLKDVYTAAIDVYSSYSIVTTTTLPDGSVIYENESSKVTVSSDMVNKFSSYYLEIKNINIQTSTREAIPTSVLNPEIE